MKEEILELSRWEKMNKVSGHKMWEKEVEEEGTVGRNESDEVKGEREGARGGDTYVGLRLVPKYRCQAC